MYRQPQALGAAGVVVTPDNDVTLEANLGGGEQQQRDAQFPGGQRDAPHPMGMLPRASGLPSSSSCCDTSRMPRLPVVLPERAAASIIFSHARREGNESKQPALAQWYASLQPPHSSSGKCWSCMSACILAWLQPEEESEQVGRQASGSTLLSWATGLPSWPR